MRRFVVEVEGLDGNVSDVEVRGELAAAVSRLHRIGGALAVGTSGGRVDLELGVPGDRAGGGEGGRS